MSSADARDPQQDQTGGRKGTQNLVLEISKIRFLILAIGKFQKIEKLQNSAKIEIYECGKPQTKIWLNRATK